eukprot:Nk52_evm21s621 gene=Nk52_evmTU21s621
MLYLEDYLETLDAFPSDMQHNFTRMREIDLNAQNCLDKVEKAAKSYFQQRMTEERKKMAAVGGDDENGGGAGDNSKAEYDRDFNKIKEQYEKCIQLSDEKIGIVDQSIELFERHFHKLEMDIKRFAKDLESETPGIVETLQKSSLDLDEKPVIKDAGRAVNRLSSAAGLSSTPAPVGRPAVGRTSSGLKSRGMRGGGARTASTMHSGDLTSSAVQPPRKRGRGASSAVSTRGGSAGVFAVPLPTRGRGRGSRGARGGRGGRGGGRGGSSSESSSVKGRPSNLKMGIFEDPTLMGADYLNSPLGSSGSAGGSTGALSMGISEEDLMMSGFAGAQLAPTIPDPNEPRYCICNGISYGEMVGCDNKDCAIEWFHYDCVGITEPPKGKWYCQDCEAAMKRKGNL